MKNFEEQPRAERKIEKIKISDEDISDWMQTLREGGFSDEEIDLMLEGLNQKYAEQKLPKAFKNSWDKIVNMVEKKRGFKMSEEKREKLFNSFLNLAKGYREKKS